MIWARRATMVLLTCALASCSSARIAGDPDGMPVVFQVDLDRAFLVTLDRSVARVGTGGGVCISSSGSSGIAAGLGSGFSPTTVYLLGGSQPGGEDLFRRALPWGRTRFTVPLQPGRMVALTVHCEGGRQGWTAIGSIRAPTGEGGPLIVITLGASGISGALPTPSVAALR